MPKAIRSLKGFFANLATNPGPCCVATTRASGPEKQLREPPAGVIRGHEGTPDEVSAHSRVVQPGDVSALGDPALGDHQPVRRDPGQELERRLQAGLERAEVAVV